MPVAFVMSLFVIMVEFDLSGHTPDSLLPFIITKERDNLVRKKIPFYLIEKL